MVLSTILILLKCFLLRQAPGGVAALDDTRTCTHGACQAVNIANIDWSTLSCQNQDTQPVLERRQRSTSTKIEKQTQQRAPGVVRDTVLVDGTLLYEIYTNANVAQREPNQLFASDTSSHSMLSSRGRRNVFT